MAEWKQIDEWFAELEENERDTILDYQKFSSTKKLMESTSTPESKDKK